MRRILILVPLALSAALLVGCAAAPASMGESGRSDMTLSPDYAVGGNPESWAPTSDGSASMVDGRDLNVKGPQIITTVNLTVTVKKPLTAADDAARIAEKLGGTVSYRSENAATDDSTASANLTLRIPSAKLTQAIDDLKELGIATDTSINAMDVTAEATDLNARITSLRTSVDRLLTLMAKATTTEDLLAAESALSQRQADLESLEAQQRNLDDQVQLSTVSLYLQSEESVPTPDPDNFWTGLVTGWNGFIAFWAGVLVAIGVLVPWLIAAALVTMIILVWVKTARRRRAASKSAPSEDAVVPNTEKATKG